MVVPRVANIPKYDRSAGGAVVDLMAGINRPLDDWQAYAIRHGLGQNVLPDMSGFEWSAPTCGCWVPRQNGKGDILMALELGWLFIFKEILVVHSAHEYKTAQEAFLRITGVIDENEDVFAQYVKRVWQANGEQGVELMKQANGKPGPRLRFMARTNKAGKGFSAPRLILDEAQELTEQMMKAILFVMSAQPNPQIWFYGTPPEEDDAWIYSVRDAGESGDPSTLWLDWGMEYADLNDRSVCDEMRQPSTWKRHNPSMGKVRPNGTGVRADAVAGELKLLGAGKTFAMDRLGMWLPRKRTAGDSSVDPEVWHTRAWTTKVKVSELGRIAVAFHVNARRTHATVGFAAMRDGKWHVGVLKHAPGTDWLFPFLKLVKETYNPICFTVDAKSETTVDDLADYGIRLPEVAEEPVRGDLILPTAGDVATAFGMLVDGANNGGLEHEDQPPMNAAVSVPPRPLAGGSTLDHKRGVEVGPGITPMLAMWAYRERDSKIKESPYDPLDFIH